MPPFEFQSPTLLATYGAPGSGKSFFSQPYVDAGWIHVNLDDIREKHKVKKREHWNIADRMILSAIAAKKHIMCDNTHIFADQLERLAAPCVHYFRYIVYFDIPIEICLERNSKRTRVVPEHVVEDYKLHMLSPVQVLRKNPQFHGLYLVNERNEVEFSVQRNQ